MRWCRGVAAALLVSVPLLPELHAGPIAEYLEDAGLGKHGAAFEAVASKQTLDLDALQALDAFELGELCTEADMSTREAIAFSRALRRRAAGGGAGAGRPAFGSSLGSASGSARRPAPPEPAPPMVERPQLRHQRRVPLAPSLPRVSVEDLASDDPAFEKFRRRSHPFILTGAMEDFKMIERFQDLEYLARMFPDAVTDFYPYNMVRPPPSPPPASRSRLSARGFAQLSKDRQNPFLTRLGRAIQQMLSPKDYSKFQYDGSAMEGRYLHLQLTPEDWRTLEQSGDIVPDRHWHLKGDEWMAECMPQPELQVGPSF